MPEQFEIGEGFQNKIREDGLKALGPERYFAEGYSFVLTDKGPLWYSKYTNEVVGPFADGE